MHRGGAQLAKVGWTARMGRWAGIAHSRGTRRILNRNALLIGEWILGQVGEGLCGVLLLVGVVHLYDEEKGEQSNSKRDALERERKSKSK